ncbi:hypothetical protein [Bifidobacterium miconisargentati]|uniref:hypothetical protein n=1 Tax=Bifidobacterium miconisargentati TaxID=2834437 RepID=UPI001BDC34C5|nr:hypothetical protein [Bifidobacterium miconisargentati]MBW3091331.1 hypothetical protein [Bifidobacterium miconisargentati]
MGQANIRAVNKTVKALKLDENGRYAANIELLRTLARQMDAAGDDPSTRLSAAFLSALKDIQRSSQVVVQVQQEERRRELNDDERREIRDTAKAAATSAGEPDNWVDYLPDWLDDFERYLIEVL